VRPLILFSCVAPPFRFIIRNVTCHLKLEHQAMVDISVLFSLDIELNLTHLRDVEYHWGITDMP